MYEDDVFSETPGNLSDDSQESMILLRGGDRLVVIWHSYSRLCVFVSDMEQ